MLRRRQPGPSPTSQLEAMCSRYVRTYVRAVQLDRWWAGRGVSLRTCTVHTYLLSIPISTAYCTLHMTYVCASYLATPRCVYMDFLGTDLYIFGDILWPMHLSHCCRLLPLCEPSQIVYLVDAGAVKPLCDMLAVKDMKVGSTPPQTLGVFCFATGREPLVG